MVFIKINESLFSLQSEKVHLCAIFGNHEEKQHLVPFIPVTNYFQITATVCSV